MSCDTRFPHAIKGKWPFYEDSLQITVFVPMSYGEFTSCRRRRSRVTNLVCLRALEANPCGGTPFAAGDSGRS